MNRYICIHGHFYQPPRENPWLEAIEEQESAYPYHDWNERITAECYAPNTASRILDERHRIASIVNNLERISFNFGPTLLSWLSEKTPADYAAILEADRRSRTRFSGHGSALAQAYNHMIMPLANQRDKETQIVWGLRDFESRFQRPAEGMWLPETAVDVATLELLSEYGLRFTILAPNQASRLRPLGARTWQDVSGGRVDPSRAYEIQLPSGRSIAAFFYDGPISRAIAFEQLLDRGENLASRLLAAFSDTRHWPQLVHIATDGETYGHHRRHADMALAYALHHIDTNGAAQLTNYGEYLDRHPPDHQVQIFEDSSWSCIHGVQRWTANCGCNSGMHAGWVQEWRDPLRQALDWLRDKVAPLGEQKASSYLKNFWEARNDYISVLLDRCAQNREKFLQRHALRKLDPEEEVIVWKLLELQRQTMLMYTSCGWFFDELSGLETVQVLQYAGRVIQLSEELFPEAVRTPFLDLLEDAKSNLPEHRDGKRIFEKFVDPAMVSLEKVAAHFAISSLFETYADRPRLYCYTVEQLDTDRRDEGKRRLAVGRVRILSEITLESAVFSYGVLHMGDHNIWGGVRPFQSIDAYQELCREVTDLFMAEDVPGLIRSVDTHFGTATYSLSLLFRDEQRRIVRTMLDQAMTEAETLYRAFYRQQIPFIRFVSDLRIKLPQRYQMAIDFTLNSDLLAALSERHPSEEVVSRLVEQIRRTGVAVDSVTLEFAYRRVVETIAEDFASRPHDTTLLETFSKAIRIAHMLPFAVNLWRAENLFYHVRQTRYSELVAENRPEDTDTAHWISRFRSLGESLGVRVE